MRLLGQLLSLTLATALCGAGLFGQATASPNLYSKALFAGIAEMEKSYAGQDSSNGGSQVPTDYRHMVVEADTEITDHLPTEQDGYHVEYLDRQAQIERYRKLRKAYPILRIHPIQDEGDHLKIGVTVSYFTFRRGRANYAVSDWANVEFKYDCDARVFVVSTVKLGGI